MEQRGGGHPPNDENVGVRGTLKSEIKEIISIHWNVALKVGNSKCNCSFISRKGRIFIS